MTTYFFCRLLILLAIPTFATELGKTFLHWDKCAKLYAIISGSKTELADVIANNKVYISDVLFNNQLQGIHFLGAGESGQAWLLTFKDPSRKKIALKLSRKESDVALENRILADIATKLGSSDAAPHLPLPTQLKTEELKKITEAGLRALPMTFQGVSLPLLLSAKYELTPEEKKIITSDISKALKALHSIGIFYRDNPFQNVVVSIDPQTKKITKASLIDFGNSSYTGTTADHERELSTWQNYFE